MTNGMQISPMYLGDSELLEIQEINNEQKQFRKYYEFDVNPEESTTLDVHYHWNGVNVEPGDVEITHVLINLVAERLSLSLVGKPFDLKTIIKEVQRFRQEFNNIGYGLCISPRMARHLEHLIGEKEKHGEHSFFTYWHRDVPYEEWLRKVWNA